MICFPKASDMRKQTKEVLATKQTDLECKCGPQIIASIKEAVLNGCFLCKVQFFVPDFMVKDLKSAGYSICQTGSPLHGGSTIISWDEK